MPEIIISQKAASFCPSMEIVVIFLRKRYPGLWTPRTWEHKIFYGSGGKVSIGRKTWMVVRYMMIVHSQTATWPAILRPWIHFPWKSSSPTVCLYGQIRGSEAGYPRASALMHQCGFWFSKLLCLCDSEQHPLLLQAIMPSCVQQDSIT